MPMSPCIRGARRESEDSMTTTRQWHHRLRHLATDDATAPDQWTDDARASLAVMVMREEMGVGGFDLTALTPKDARHILHFWGAALAQPDNPVWAEGGWATFTGALERHIMSVYVMPWWRAQRAMGTHADPGCESRLERATYPDERDEAVEAALDRAGL